MTGTGVEYHDKFSVEPVCRPALKAALRGVETV